MKRIKSAKYVFGLTIALVATLITGNPSVYFEGICPSASAAAKGDGSDFGYLLTEPDSVDRVKLTQAYGRLPLSFEANRGQADPRVNFISNGNGYRLFLTPTEAVVVFSDPGSKSLAADASSPNQKAKTRNQKPVVFRMSFVGANDTPHVEGLDQLPARSSYFLGRDATKWRTDIPNFSRVKYEKVYPGIDLIYHGNQQQLEYDFLVAAGANPGAIKIAFEGARSMYVDAQGDLLMHTSGGPLRQHKPVAYQEVDGVRKEIPCRFVVKGRREVGFQVAGYDITRPLVIDPVFGSLVYSTYLGGSGVEMGLGIAVDSDGNAYVTGVTSSIDFPSRGEYYDTGFNGTNDVFVTKLNYSGTSVLYSAFIGGNGNDRGQAIALASDKTAYVTGQTSSADFPIMGRFYDEHLDGASDVFIARLSDSGTGLLYSTYLGGGGVETANGIAVDYQYSAYVTGNTSPGPPGSDKFPTTDLTFQEDAGGGQDAFVTKIAGGAYILYYSTFLGGSDEDAAADIAVDNSLRACVVGSTKSGDFPHTQLGDHLHGPKDAFATRLSSDGRTAEYSGYLGGSGTEDGFRVMAPPVGSTFYVTGATSSWDFPTTGGSPPLSGPTDAFVMKLSPPFIVMSRFLGGPYIDKGYGIASHGGFIYLTGETHSTTFPGTSGVNNGGRDAFVAVLEDNGTLRESTFLGGSGDEDGRRIAASIYGDIYVTGYTKSVNFPTTNGALSRTLKGGQDAFVTKFNY